MKVVNPVASGQNQARQGRTRYARHCLVGMTIFRDLLKLVLRNQKRLSQKLTCSKTQNGDPGC